MEVLVTLNRNIGLRSGSWDYYNYGYLAGKYGHSRPFIVKTSNMETYKHCYIWDYRYLPKSWFTEVVVKNLSYEEML